MGDSRALNVGVYFNARPEHGGLYQYAVTLIHCLYAHEPRHRYTLFHATLEPVPLQLEAGRWKTVMLSKPEIALGQLTGRLVQGAARRGLRRPVRIVPVPRAIRAAPLDILLYVQPTIHSFLWRHPSLFPIHDLQHLFQPEFPEVSAGGEAARREYIYRNAVLRAAGILADSETGREDIIGAYAAEPGRVHALPYLAPTYLAAAVTEADLIRVRGRYQPPANFLFYPAVFWPHKNHARLLRALARLKSDHGLCLPLLLAGNRKREYEALVRLAHELEIAEQVRFLGYVPDEDMYPLYRLALALVMPTFFGPTNIPVLEAWAHGCPVITSDIRGIREQVGEAGLLVDPRDEQSIAEAIWRLQSDSGLREALAERGKRRVAEWTPQAFAERLGDILSESGRQPQPGTHASRA